MKKIREILFTIVVIASCGCLLNVNIFASLPQNYDLIETESVSGKEEAAEEEEEARKFKKWLETTLDADPPSPESQGMHRHPKPYEEWLAEYEKNELEGNFTEPSRFKEEEEQATGGQEEEKSTDIFWGRTSLNSYIRKMVLDNNVVKTPSGLVPFGSGPGRTTFFTDGFEDNNLKSPLIKPYEEWLAEYKKNEREGNFTPPPVFREEGEQVTEEQENSWLLPSFLNEEGGNDWSSPPFATRIESIPEISVSTLPPPIHAISSTSICAEDEDNSTDDIPAQTEIDDSDIYDADNIF